MRGVYLHGVEAGPDGGAGQRGGCRRRGLIQSLLAAGLTSSTVLDVRPCIDDEAIRTPWLAARLHRELDRVEEQITGLRQTRDILAGLVDRYRVDDLG